MPKTTEEQLVENTDKILRLLAVLATSGMNQREQIALLDKAGLEPKDIADLLGTSGNTVRVALVKIRRKNREKGPKRSRRKVEKLKTN